jgi:hypothetical protein
VGEGEGDALRAGGDDIDALAAVVGKGWAKDEGAIPMRGPSVAMVGTGESKTELAGGVEGVGGEIVWEVVKARPGRDRGIRAPGTEDVEGDLGKGEESVPEVVGKVRVGR